MNAAELYEQIRAKGSFLCIGLDTDFSKLPKTILDEEYPLFEFNKRIVDATHDLAVAYKPNLAFYENMGTAGWMSLELTVKYIREKYPELFLIADAKRGDIGNTSRLYAEAFFNNMDFDAVTLSPYMGKDSIAPYLSYENKWSIILALTSNEGSGDLQQMKASDDKFIFEHVIHKIKAWGNSDNTMLVVGATKSEQFKKIRRMVPDHFLLVPGVGTQGGSLKDVFLNGHNARCGLLVNVSRAIIYSDVTNRFEISARQKAIEYRSEMEQLLASRHLI